MNFRKFSVVLFLASCCAGTISAQNFFWSDVGFEQGAINNDLVINANSNPSGTVYLYYNSNGADVRDAVDVNLSWGEDGIIGFTAAETFEADITFGIDGPLINQRWGDFAGTDPDLTSNFATLLAVNVVSGQGIRDANIPGVVDDNGIDFVDTLYDTSAGAFLVGSFDFEVLSFGGTDLLVDAVISDGVAGLQPRFSELHFSIVPEPSATILVLLGLAGFATRRCKG